MKQQRHLTLKSLLILTAACSILMIISACQTDIREFKSAKEYYETGELKKEEIRNSYEYECKEYYKNGDRKKVIYGTEGHLLIREFFPDGSLKREEKTSPNKEFHNIMN